MKAPPGYRDECTRKDCKHSKENHVEGPIWRTPPYGDPRQHPIVGSARLACLAHHCTCPLYEWNPPEDDDA